MVYIDIETDEWRAAERRAEAGSLIAHTRDGLHYDVINLSDHQTRRVSIDGKLVCCTCNTPAYCEHMVAAWAEHVRDLQWHLARELVKLRRGAGAA